MEREFALKQYITDYTRVTNTSKTAIDLLFTNSQVIQRTGVLNYNLSDHLPIFCIRKKDRNLLYLVVDHIDYDPDKLRRYLQSLDWNEFYTLNDPSQCWQFMYNAILDEIDRQCPIKEITLKKVKPMWMNDYLLYLVNERDKKFKRAKQTDNREDWLEARKLRNLTKGVDKAGADFIKSNLNSCKNDSKKFWKQLREILPNDKSNKRFGLVDQSSGHRVEENDTAN